MGSRAEDSLKASSAVEDAKSQPLPERAFNASQEYKPGHVRCVAGFLKNTLNKLDHTLHAAITTPFAICDLTETDTTDTRVTALAKEMASHC